MIERLAVVSYHSSPLLEPGSGDSGGMTIYVRALARAMAQVGVRTDVFTRASGDGPRATELVPGVRVVAIEAGPVEPVDKRVLPRFIDDFAAGIRAFATAQRTAYDAVHSHYWQSGLAARELARSWRIPFVHSHHTLGRVKNRYLAPGDDPEPPMRLEGESAIIDAADVLIASTDDEWEHLSCLYGAPHDRLKIVHPGVDHATFRPLDRVRSRRSLGLGDAHVLLYAGRIQRLKGLDLALRAVEQLSGALERDLVFLVVGGASGSGGDAEIARLAALARTLGIERSVRFVGTRSHHDLPTFYSAADAVLVCSHSESFGLAALEAQACGTPVVATAVGGLRHVVRDGASGFLVDTRDPTTFAGRLKDILGDGALATRFRAAAVRSAARFSWERAADELVELYDCLGERAPDACTC